MLASLKPLESLRKVKQVRGLGMVFGIQFPLPIAPVVALACYRKGLITAFSSADTLFFTPALAMDRRTALKGAAILKQVLGYRGA